MTDVGARPAARPTALSVAAGPEEPPALAMPVAGSWGEAAGGQRFEVRSPATGAVVATVPDGAAADTIRAVEAAAEAFPAWAARPAGERAEVLAAAAALMLERAEELARLIALEEGKPIAESRGEVRYAAGFLSFFAEEGRRGRGEVLAPHLPGKRLWTLRQPVGVAGLITIWNFPAAGITRPLGAALAAGCTAVVKPAEQTPLSALAVFELLEAAGLPAGAASLVCASDPEPVGRVLVEHPAVRKISFTGSAPVGTRLAREAAAQVKRVTLELGGHAPFLVFADADLDAAARGAVVSKFRNSGQTCVAVNRILVEERVAEAFTARLVDLVGDLRVGDPLDEHVQVGPLIDAAALAKVEAHVQDARERGARVLAGGERREVDGLDGLFYAPTVLAGATPEMLAMREETFGPVAPVATFASEAEAVAAANGLPWGLAAYVWSRDADRCLRVAEALECGVVGINDPLPGAPHVPFGGVKASGLGREGGRAGLDEFLETKLVSLQA